MMQIQRLSTGDEVKAQEASSLLDSPPNQAVQTLAMSGIIACLCR